VQVLFGFRDAQSRMMVAEGRDYFIVEPGRMTKLKRSATMDR
jgi:hypothetical protein